MGSNGIKGAEAGKALGDALAANTMLKELDLISSVCVFLFGLRFVLSSIK